MSDHEQAKRPPLTQTDRAIIAKIQSASDKRRVSDPLTGEGGDYIDALAHLAMSEVHKRGPSLVVDKPAVRGHFVERTPEQQAEHDAVMRREGHRLGREAVGLKFTLGRQPGAASPIRKAIARELKKAPGMKNPELWDAIAAKPPKGWEFCRNSLGRYAEASGGKNMDYKRFCNVCGEERGKLKG